MSNFDNEKNLSIFIIILYIILLSFVVYVLFEKSSEFQILTIIVCFAFLFLAYLLFQNIREQKKRQEEQEKTKEHLIYSYEKQKITIREFDNRLRQQEYQLDKFQRSLFDIEGKISLSYEGTETRFGVQAIYLEYKILEVIDFSKILNSYYTLYKLFYQIQTDNSEKFINTELRYKEHPEDILQILSAHTGNSIIFKTKTGWKPSIGTKDGDIEVALPKGIISLLFLGYVLKELISFGITSYKDIVEIMHTNLEDEKIRNEIQMLKEKSKKQSEEMENRIQQELNNFYNLTIKNQNIIQIAIDQNDNFVE